MPVKLGFQPSIEVSNPALLFGHNEPRGYLEQLINYIRLGSNTQVLGERRAGKTSLLRCCARKLSEEIPTLIPVYINYRDYPDVRGYSNAYRLLLAAIYVRTIKVGNVPPDVIQLGMPPATPDLSLDKCYQQLCGAYGQEADSNLEKYVELLNKRGFGIALLIDEYEHLMRHTFEGQDGEFFRLRELSSASAIQEGSPKPFTYVIAGAKSWDKLCEMMGSPELNNTGSLIYLGPIGPESFKKMWNKGVEETEEELRTNLVNSPYGIEEVYTLAGGWPYYGKVIGQLISMGNYDETSYYQTLLQHFNVVWLRLDDREKFALYRSVGERRDGDIGDLSTEVRNLIWRGLIIRDGEGLAVPCGRLWGQYLVEQADRYTPESTERINNRHRTTYQLHLLVDDISMLVMDINEISMNIIHKAIFEVCYQDTRTYFDLSRPATNGEQFTHFALALYNLLYERTSDFIPGDSRVRTLQRLPKQFQHKRTIIRAANIIRHHYGKGHLTGLETFDMKGAVMEIGDALETYLGVRIISQDEEYLSLQEKLLEALHIYLQQLKEHLTKDAKRMSNASAGEARV